MIDFTDIGDLTDLDPDSIDPSESFHSDGYDNSGEFDDTETDFDFYSLNVDELEFDGSDIEDTQSLTNDFEENASEMNSSHKHYRSSNIAFTGNGKCRICNCGGWAGFGDTCANCGHFYNKHI